MQRLTGMIISEPTHDAGRIVFTLKSDRKKQFRCVSAVDYEGSVPNCDDSVILMGEQNLGLASTPTFVFSELYQ